jgi:hypothetical protein
LHVVAGLVKRRVAGANAFFASHDQPLRALAASPVPAARTKAAEVCISLFIYIDSYLYL